MKNSIAIIPARFGSSRFPGKPLVDILGTPMVIAVARNVIKAFGWANTFVATDSKKIAAVCEKHDVKHVFVEEECRNGSERCILAFRKLKLSKETTLFNIQGDEPTLTPNDLSFFKEKVLADLGTNAANAFYRQKVNSSSRGSNSIKMVNDRNGNLLYASRAEIPNNAKREGKSDFSLQFQVGMYALSSEARGLFMSKRNEVGALEESEDIEILRLIEFGMEVKMVELGGTFIPVDTPEDIPFAERLI